MRKTDILPKPKGLTIKYALRLSLIPAYCRLLRILGVSWEIIRKSDKLRKETLLPQLSLYDSSEMTDQIETPLLVVIFTMMGSHSFMTATEISIARALVSRGHKVQLVLCDQQLPLCENKTSANRDSWKETCGYCYAYGSRMFAKAGLKVLPVSQLVETLSDKEVLECRRPDRWQHVVESSLFKFFKVGKLRNTDDEKAIADKFKTAAETSAMAAVAVSNMNPDRVIMSHGVYATWAPALKVLSDGNIPVAVYNKGKKRNSAVFNWAVGEMEWDVSSAWRSLKERSLTDSERKQLDAYLLTRVDHSKDALKYNFGARETLDETYKRLDIDPNKLTFVLFTNVLWDAASAQKELAFPNAVEWVFETIEWFVGRPDKQLIVKIHPAEVVIGTNQPFENLITERVPQLPVNIRIIAPHEKVNSWSMIEVADMGLVHTSTVGMELPLVGVPCVVVSKTHFRGKGFTIDIGSREEYFEVIDSLTEDSAKTSDETTDLALKYAYLFFEKYHLPWSFLIEEKYGEYRGFNFNDAKSLYANETMRTIVSGIETCSEFMLERAAK